MEQPKLKVKESVPKGTVVHLKELIQGEGRKVYLDNPTKKGLLALWALNHPFVEKK